MIEADYDPPVRVDKHDKPTHKTTEIVQNLINADLVVADLSGSNANVYYELGIRHAFGKPCIMLSDWELAPPFDISGTNIIQFTHDDPASHRDAISRIVGQAKSFESEDSVSNPVTIANGFTELSSRGDDKDMLMLGMHADLSKLSSRFDQLEKQLGCPPRTIPTQNALAGLIGASSEIVDHTDDFISDLSSDVLKG